MKTIYKIILHLTLSTVCFFQLKAQEIHVLTSDSVKLFVRVKGEGTPCLYLHGGPGSGSYWMEKFMGDFLERQFQMIYLDQRGVGRSASPSDNNYSLERMAKDFEEVREYLGYTKWLTMGHSFGGILQLGYVDKYPEAIDGMIFINCTLSLEESFGSSWLPRAIELAGKDVPAICLDPAVSLYNRMIAIMPLLNEKGLMWKLFFANEESSHIMNDTYKDFDSWNISFSEIAMEIDDYWNDFRVLAPSIHKPVLFFYGKRDWAIGPDHYSGVLFPDMITWGYEGSHMPFLEGRQDLTRAILYYKNYYQD